MSKLLRMCAACYPANIAEQLTRRRSLRREDVKIRPQFKVGQRVRARNINPVGHTRLPRYMRGHRGTIMADHGIFDFQDTDAEGYALPDRPQARIHGRVHRTRVVRRSGQCTRHGPRRTLGGLSRVRLSSMRLG